MTHYPQATYTATPQNPQPPVGTPHQQPLVYIDVFIDDFISLAQGNSNCRRHLLRTLLHSIDQVFRPLDPQDPTDQKEPISFKKLQSGDAAWTTTKTILGWTINTQAMTIALPPHCQARMAKILTGIPATQWCISLDKWHQTLGELRSMALAIPGARGLFSLLQEAFKNPNNTNHRIRLTPAIHQTLQDFQLFHDDLNSQPTRLYELVPQPPILIGSHDASRLGAGGIWLPSNTAIT